MVRDDLDAVMGLVRWTPEVAIIETHRWGGYALAAIGGAVVAALAVFLLG